MTTAEFISFGNAIVVGGEQDQYDWSKYPGGYAGFLQDLAKAKASQKPGTLAYARTHPSRPENIYESTTTKYPSPKETSSFYYVTPSGAKYPGTQLGQEAAFTSMNEVKLPSSSKTITFYPNPPLGFVGLGNMSAQSSELASRPRRGIYGPAVAVPAGSPGAWFSAQIASIMMSLETPFSGIDVRLGTAGAELFSEAVARKTGEDNLGGALFASATVAAGVTAAVFDIVTFPIRPLIWIRTLQGISQAIASPSEFVKGQSELFMANPAYSIGYAGGLLLAPSISKTLSESVKEAGSAAYEYMAPKTPLLRSYYYSKMFPVNTAYPEFNLGGLTSEAGGGSAIRGAAKFYGQAVPTQSLSAFNAFKTPPLPPIKMPFETEISFYKLAPRTGTYQEAWNVGGSVTKGAIATYKAGQSLVKYPETQLLTGSAFRGSIQYLEMPHVSGSRVLGGMRTQVEFMKLQGISTIPGVYQPTIRNLPRRTPANLGFSMVESGIPSKYLVSYKRSATTLTQPVQVSPASGLVAPGAILASVKTRPYPSRNRGMIPNPYYNVVEEAGMASIEQIYSGVTTPTRLSEQSRLFSISAISLKGLTGIKPFQTNVNRVTYSPAFKFDYKSILKTTQSQTLRQVQVSRQAYDQTFNQTQISRQIYEQTFKQVQIPTEIYKFEYPTKPKPLTPRMGKRRRKRDFSDILNAGVYQIRVDAIRSPAKNLGRIII
jgi:hypothetical protein